MAEFADDTERLRANFKRILMSTSLLSIYLSLLIAACARALILTLIGEKWAESIPYLQLLCFATMLFPVHALNLNMLKVKGRSDLFLRLEVVKKLLAIPAILIGISYGIIAMILMKIISSIVALYINAYYSAKLISYPPTVQLMDITKSIVLSLSVIFPVYLFAQTVDLRPSYELSSQVFIGLIGGICIIMFSKNTGATELKQITLEYVRKMKNKLHR